LRRRSHTTNRIGAIIRQQKLNGPVHESGWPYWRRRSELDDDVRTIIFIPFEPFESVLEDRNIGRVIACKFDRSCEGNLGTICQGRLGYFSLVSADNDPLNVPGLKPGRDTPRQEGMSAKKPNVLLRSTLGATLRRNYCKDVRSINYHAVHPPSTIKLAPVISDIDAPPCFGGLFRGEAALNHARSLVERAGSGIRLRDSAIKVRNAIEEIVHLGDEHVVNASCVSRARIMSCTLLLGARE
jgi:hypothetical protein